MLKYHTKIDSGQFGELILHHFLCFQIMKFRQIPPNEYVVMLFVLKQGKFTINISPSLELIYFLRVT